MTPERWQRLKVLVADALALDASGRASFVGRIREEDPGMADEVTSLLAAHDRAADFIETPALEETVSREVFAAMQPAAWTGRRIGSYVIERELGHGGMGVVYLASRADESFRHRVAIKVVRGHFGGEGLHQRFRRERQILANLEHPNIARLIDGGSLEDGSPYFVMEYVEGQSIDRYVEERQLSVEARIALVRQVAAAVHYAHQRLVVHRDLKPGNILVTADGVPKLLDFGIAKLVGDDAAPDLTATRIMTLENASPEQVRGEAVTTATDVYALGVMLYVLLTGRSPYVVARRTPHELTRAICEVEPERPSAVAARAGSTLASARWHELDAIVLKALRKEPDRRYGGVDQLDADLARYERGLPVTALPDALPYRVRKFVARHRAAVAGAAAVVVALVGGIVATTWQAQIARAERARAEARFNDVRKLANLVIFDMHDAIESLPGSTGARRLLVTGALEYLDRIGSESTADRELQRELANAYERVADVQGRPNASNIGDLHGARASYRKAQEIRDRLARQFGADATLEREMASTSGKLTTVLWFTGELEPAEVEARRALTLERAELERTSTDAQKVRVAIAHDQVAYTLGLRGKSTDALEHLREAESILQPMATTANPEAKDWLSTVYGHMGELLLSGAPIPGVIPDQPAAVEMFRRELVINEELADADPRNFTRRRNVMVGHIHVADALQTTDPAAALDHYRRVLPIAEETVQIDPEDSSAQSDLALMYERVGSMSVAVGAVDEGLRYLHRAVEAMAPVVARDPASYLTRARVAAVRAGLGRAYARQADAAATPEARAARLEAARKELAEALAFWLEVEKKAETESVPGNDTAAVRADLAAVEQSLAATRGR